jgi:hypothetical protein
MPDISVFKEKLKSLQDAVRAKLPDIATTLTLSAKAISERRIKDQGFGAEYSKTPIPAWFFHDKELNAQGTAFLNAHGVTQPGAPKKAKRAKKGEGIPKADREATWGEFRAAQGLQNGFVDLSYSNKMFAAMIPQEVQVNGDIYSAPLGASNQQAQKEMNYNFERYGDFIGKALQPEDFNLLGDVVITEFDKLISAANLIP